LILGASSAARIALVAAGVAVTAATVNGVGAFLDGIASLHVSREGL
jgi:hypothetical protein